MDSFNDHGGCFTVAASHRKKVVKSWVGGVGDQDHLQDASQCITGLPSARKFLNVPANRLGYVCVLPGSKLSPWRGGDGDNESRDPFALTLIPASSQ